MWHTPGTPAELLKDIDGGYTCGNEQIYSISIYNGTDNDHYHFSVAQMKTFQLLVDVYGDLEFALCSSVKIPGSKQGWVQVSHRTGALRGERKVCELQCAQQDIAGLVAGEEVWKWVNVSSN